MSAKGLNPGLRVWGLLGLARRVRGFTGNPWRLKMYVASDHQALQTKSSKQRFRVPT